jgi:hypothetical protein
MWMFVCTMLCTSIRACAHKLRAANMFSFHMSHQACFDSIFHAIMTHFVAVGLRECTSLIPKSWDMMRPGDLRYCVFPLLVGWLVGSLVGWLVCWLAGCLAGRLVGWSYENMHPSFLIRRMKIAGILLLFDVV